MAEVLLLCLVGLVLQEKSRGEIRSSLQKPSWEKLWGQGCERKQKHQGKGRAIQKHQGRMLGQSHKATPLHGSGQPQDMGDHAAVTGTG